MTLDEPFALKHTNVSRPQLAHAGSKQSETASEDYFSLSDGASSNGDDTPYRTPPSRFRSPDLGNGKNASRSLLSLVTSAKRRHQEQPSSSRQDNIGIKRKPVPSRASPPAAPPDPSLLQPPRRTMDEMAPTPGIDDTPYIRFAIEQLTRDEDVRGSRNYESPSNVPLGDDDEIIPDTRRRSIHQDQQRELGQSPPTPPQYPEHTIPENPLTKYDTLSTQQDKFVPYHPPKYSIQHPALNFRPAILRPVSLGIFIFLCLLMLTGLLFAAGWSLTHNGLWDYGTFGDGRYFIFEYLPTLLGIILFMWLIQIEIALYRISPFIAMASDSTYLRCYGPLLDLYPTRFLLPDLQHFKAGLPLIGAVLIISWLQIFTIPLLASSFDVRYDGNPANGAWRWMAVQGVIWVAIVLFITLVVALLALLFYLQRVRTGLRWDPRCIADVVALLERANNLGAYHNSEAFSYTHHFADRLQGRSDRLGYWHTYKHPAYIFYGLGEEGAPTRRYTIENGQIREKEPDYAPGDVDLEAQSQRPISQQPLRRSFSPVHFRDGSINFALIRHRYLPWFLHFSSSLLWALTATILLLAFLIVSFVNRAVLAGFLPDLPVGANSAGFSAPNFLFSFIPSVLGMLCFLLWLPIDLSFRRLEPYAELSKAEGATADRSLLLDYTANVPFLCTLHALTNRHWRVAIISFVTLLAATFPILAGGVFWAQFYTNTQNIRVTAESSAYYPLCVFLAIYAAAYWAAFAGRNRSLPHESKTVAEIISWIYMSRIITDEAFAGVRTKTELVTRLLSIPVGERSGLPTAPSTSVGARASTAAAPRIATQPPSEAGAASSSAPPNLAFDTTGYAASSHNPDVDPDVGYEVESTSHGQRTSQRLQPPSQDISHIGPSTSTFESDSTGRSTRPTGIAATLSALNTSVLSLASRVGRIKARHPSLVEPKAEPRVPRYAFGIYKGRDGREHLGIDRVVRPGAPGVVVLSGVGDEEEGGRGPGSKRVSWRKSG